MFSLNVEEHIRLQAYLIAKERQRQGTPGTPEEDWLKARNWLWICDKQVALEAHKLASNRWASQGPDDPVATWLAAEQKLLRRRMSL